jgi:acetylornithine deacetylase/succinyl-diaminopimelate desuccinylase family protein
MKNDHEIFDAIESTAPIELLAKLVQIPSHPGVPNQEAAVVAALAEFLERGGLRPELEEIVDGRPNLMCTLEGAAPGPHLLLCGHTDTVPLNATDSGVGFSGRIDGGRIHGRGTTDMKGAVAAMAAALVALGRNGLPAAGRVTLAAVIDEEIESLGAEHLIESGFTADGAIVGEPTQNQICIGHKGLEWLEIVFIGKAAHGGTPKAGVNAIDAAASFVHRVRTSLLGEFDARADSLLGPPTLNFGTVRGGDQPSTVAASCVLTADRRSLPDESYEQICAELESVLDAVKAEMPGLSTTLRRLPGGMATLEHVALKTSPSDAVVEAAVAARRRVCGRAGELGAFPAWTDGALIAAFAGIPTLILGPGDLAVAHSPVESVEIAQVIEAARIYAVAATEFCGRTT